MSIVQMLSKRPPPQSRLTALSLATPLRGDIRRMCVRYPIPLSADVHST